MTLRIACDLDGTLADMDSALQDAAECLFGPGVSVRGVSVPVRDDEAGAPNEKSAPAETGKPAIGLTDREMRRLWAHVRSQEDFWLTLAEIEPGAVARLFGLSSRHRWEVLFLTQRPSTAGGTAQLQSQRWLEEQGFALPSVYVMHGSRGKVADAFALDVLIDDRPANCLDVVTDSTARAVLLWRDPTATVPLAAARLGIETVRSMAEAFDLLQRPARPAVASGGIAGRLRSAIGP